MSTDKNSASVWQNLKNHFIDLKGVYKIESKISEFIGYLQTAPYPKDKIMRESLKERLKELKAERNLVDTIKETIEKQNKQGELLSKLAHLKADLEEEMKSEV